MSASALIAPFQKACKKCGELRPLDHFPKCAAARDGRVGQCRFCKQAKRLAHKTPEERDQDRARVRRWKRANADRWRESKREQSRRKRREQGARSKEEVVAEAAARREAEKIMKAQAREAKQAERATKPWNAPGLSGAEKFSIRYRCDPDFNLKQRLRASFKRKRQGIRLGDMLRGAIARGGSSPVAERFVGYSAADLRRHLERQFTRGMSWQRFCAGDIHIDHIVPLSSFDLSSEKSLRAAWALANLRPAWAADNLAKAAKRVCLL